MISNIFSENIMNIITKRCSLNDVYEIRLRKGKNIYINVSGNYVDSGVICNPQWIEEIVLRASRYSIYTVNEQIKAGYLSVQGGIRIGICGETVYDAGGLKTIKNISSLNIRFPHEVKGCSDKVIEYCFKNRLNNTLVISRPGAGKTTLIRDICRNLCNVYKHINILILDERGEISGETEGVFQFNTGNSDVLLNCKKEFGFSCGIRSMRPDVIVCDELKGNEDSEAVFEALSCGVCVVATVHADSLQELKLKGSFKEILSSRAFDRYVLLSDIPKVGTIKNIYNENMEVI